MARESFDDPKVAAFVNAHYIAILVDREERPDVDALYVRAVEMLRGSAGWPLNVLLTPDGDPFFGASYVPPNAEARNGEGFLHLLEHMHEELRKNPESLRATGGDLRRRMQAETRWSRPKGMPDAQALIFHARSLSDVFNADQGGFAGAPQFPPALELDFLLRYHRRTGDARSLSMVELTLERMAAGALRDPIEGGFHRYTVDRAWLRPHFETMLYVNALLASLYLDAFQATGKRLYREIGRDTLAFLDERMSTQSGAFCAGIAAESDDASGRPRDGYYYAFDEDTFERVLGKARAKKAAALLLPPAKERPEGVSTFAPALAYAIGPSTTIERALDAVAPYRQALSEERRRRAAPHRDCTALVEWNALAISAFVRGAIALEDDLLAARAERAAQTILKTARDADGRLRRNDRPGAPDAFLPDYANLVAALLDLHQVRPLGPYLREAISLQERADGLFWDKASAGYFLSYTAHGALIDRDKPLFDRATPAGNATMVANLIRIAALTANDKPQKRAEDVLTLFANAIRWEGTKLPAMLSALERALDDRQQILIVLAPDDAGKALRQVRARLYAPNAATYVLADRDVATLTQQSAIFEGKRALTETTAYVCKEGRCEQPTASASTMEAQLRPAPLIAGEPPETYSLPIPGR